MRSFSSRAGRSVLALAVVALSACGDRSDVTEASPNLRPRLDVVSNTPAITALTLSSDTVVIGNSNTLYTATLQNPGASRSPVGVTGVIVQDTVHRTDADGGQFVQCGSGTGVLPTGSCTVSNPVAVSNSGGGTALVPGPATFELQLTDAVTGAVLSTKTVAITLVPNTPTISAVTLSSSTVVLNGPFVPYTATFKDPGPGLPNVDIQGLIVQGTSQRDAGRAPVDCGIGVGALPTGTCTFSFQLTASNSNGLRHGTLVLGPATFVLQLRNALTGAVFDTKTVGITLVSNATTITALSVSADTVAIGGSSTRYTATLNNPVASRPNVFVRGNIRQGTVLRAAGGALVQCGSGTGVLPTGSCTVSNPIVASNSGGGTALLPGPATFELQLTDSISGFVFDTKTVAITLVSSTPTITALTLSTDTLVIGSSSVPYTATLRNPGPSLSNVRIQSSITQGTTSRAAGGPVVNCGSGSGVLPTGICTVSGVAVASNFTSGTGTLSPGVAIFSLQLVDANGTVVDTVITKVILTSPGSTDPVDGL